MGHLWKRPSGYVFQIHIPQGFVDRFGATLIRVDLGRLPASEARRRAHILAGRATAMIEIGVRREVVARSLEALAAEMDRLKRSAFSVGMCALPRFRVHPKGARRRTACKVRFSRSRSRFTAWATGSISESKSLASIGARSPPLRVSTCAQKVRIRAAIAAYSSQIQR